MPSEDGPFIVFMVSVETRAFVVACRGPTEDLRAQMA